MIDWSIVTDATHSIFGREATVTVGDESFAVKGIFSNQGKLADRQMRMRPNFADELDIAIFTVCFDVKRSTIPAGVHITPNDQITIDGVIRTIQKTEIAAAGDVRCWLG